MIIDLEQFKELREALKFKGNDHDFVYAMCTGFENPLMCWKRVEQWETGVDLSVYGYEFVDGEDCIEYSWGVFSFNDKFYKGDWEYCKVACEWDYWYILGEGSFYEVKPVTKTITIWEAV